MPGIVDPDHSGVAGLPVGHPPGHDAAIVLVSFPHQLLHALCALRHERRMHGIPENAPATFLVWSYRSAHHEAGSRFRELMSHALQNFPWARLYFPTRFERIFHLSPYRLLTYRAAWLKKKLGSTEYRTCYYSHDASADHTAQALMQAFPAAKHVCYGDPPGFLYPAPSSVDASYFPRSALKQLFWRSRLGGLRNLLHASVSIISVDFRPPSQTLQPQQVHVLPRALLLETLFELKAGLRSIAPEIDAWAEAQTPGTPDSYLLLLSNFTDSGMTTRADELAMYAEICQAHVPPGRTIYLKPHIGTPPEFISLLLSRLSAYNVIVFPTAAQQLPIELFPELLTRSHVLSVSSSSALIAYLFEHSVSHVLTENLIQRYFRPGYIAYMLAANRAIAEKTSSTRV